MHVKALGRPHRQMVRTARRQVPDLHGPGRRPAALATAGKQRQGRNVDRSAVKPPPPPPDRSLPFPRTIPQSAGREGSGPATGGQPMGGGGGPGSSRLLPSSRGLAPYRPLGPATSPTLAASFPPPLQRARASALTGAGAPVSLVPLGC
ncbi:hypothetical protein CDD83_9031 [Cordyceps sp. RAO-2017]|nr:hypothetical protein CDD83_9031 [Cordyceps sp. RAO-2017]